MPLSPRCITWLQVHSARMSFELLALLGPSWPHGPEVRGEGWGRGLNTLHHDRCTVAPSTHAQLTQT